MNPAPEFPNWITADLPGIGGSFKASPEDFLVEEIAAYEPSGTGDFLYLWVEKRDLAAGEFVRVLGKSLGIQQQDIGVAGLKDKVALTQQWVSVPLLNEEKLSQIDHPGIRILKTGRHNNKLKTGHLSGNRFQIRIRGTVNQSQERLVGLLERIHTLGIPNAYDRQRFGRGNETLKLGWEILSGNAPRSIKPWLRRLAVSALQSGLYNTYLLRRQLEGNLHRVIPGEVLAKCPAGGMFRAPTDPEALGPEQARMDTHEITSAGPIFGWKLFAAEGLAKATEDAILAQSGLNRESFLREKRITEGTRRRNLIFPQVEVVGFEDRDVVIRFELPSGSYATRVLGELMHSEETAPESLVDSDSNDNAEFPDT